MASSAHSSTVHWAPGQRSFYRLATILLVIGVLFWAKTIFIPLALAILLSFALSPVAAWLEKRGLGRVPSCLLVSIGALGLLTGLGWIAGGQIRQLVRDMETKDYAANVKRKLEPVMNAIESLDQFGILPALAVSDPVNNPGGQPADPDNPIPGQPADGSKAPVPVTLVRPKGAEILAWLPSVAQPAVEGLATALLVTVLTIFMLIQRESVRDRLLALAGKRQLTATTRALQDAGQRVSRFLLLQAATNATMGLIVCIGLSVIGVPYAALWGLMTAAMRFVPYVGIWLSAIPPIALAVSVFPGWTQAVLVFAVYAGFDLVMTNVVEPLLFGRGTGVSSLALLVAAAFWAFLWGPVGLLLAVPLTVCLVVLGEHISSLRFLRTLLGDEPSVDPAALYFHRVISHQQDEASLLVGEQAAARPLVEVYDEVILPAVVQAKTEQSRGDLTSEEESEFYRTTRSVLRGVLAGYRAAVGGAEQPAEEMSRVVGCSTRGEADRLALGMLRDLDRPAGGDVEIVSAGRFAGAVHDRTTGGVKVVAVIVTISPGGLAQAIGLCKQVRQRCPDLKVVVCRWETNDDRVKSEQLLKAAGAAEVAWQLKTTLAAIAGPVPDPEASIAAQKSPAETGKATAPVRPLAGGGVA